MKIKIKKSSKGRGVYASKTIRKGEIVETCELLLIKTTELPESLEPYVYEYSHTRVALALGVGSLFNHSEKPNSEFFYDSGKNLLIIQATKKISVDQEITINYGYDEELKRRFKLR